MKQTNFYVVGFIIYAYLHVLWINSCYCTNQNSCRKYFRMDILCILFPWKKILMLLIETLTIKKKIPVVTVYH